MFKNRATRGRIAGIVLGLVAAGPAMAQDSPVCALKTRLKTGQYLLAATWPSTATQVCFVETQHDEAKPEHCLTERIQLGPERLLQIGEELFEVDETCGPAEGWDGGMAYIALGLTPNVRWEWSAYAINDIGRSAKATPPAVIDLREPPQAPVMLLVDQLVDEAKALVRRAREVRREVQKTVETEAK